MLNSLNTNDSKRSIMPVRADQSLSGTVYGEHHNAKILKQFSNWTSPEVQRDLYRYARQDMIEQFSEVQMKFYNPENTENIILARSQNIKTMGGLGMLLYQAIPSFESFFGVRPKVSNGLKQHILEHIRRAK